jgi:hypothetical protein
LCALEEKNASKNTFRALKKEKMTLILIGLQSFPVELLLIVGHAVSLSESVHLVAKLQKGN